MLKSNAFRFKYNEVIKPTIMHIEMITYKQTKNGRLTDLLIFIMVGFLKNGSLYSFNEHDFCIYVCFHPLFYECIQCKYEISSKYYNNVSLS